MTMLASESSCIIAGMVLRMQSIPFTPSENRKTPQRSCLKQSFVYYRVKKVTEETQEFTRDFSAFGLFSYAEVGHLSPGESFLEEKEGSVFSFAPTSLVLQSLFSHNLSLPCVTVCETLGSIRVRGSEPWKKSLLVF